MKKLMKRGVALVLAVMMCVGMLSVSASALWPWDNQCKDGHTPSFNGSGGYTTCKVCGESFRCTNHQDLYCGTHGGYNQQLHGDGECDYCHYKFQDAKCPEVDPTCPGHNQDKQEKVHDADCSHAEEWKYICSNCGKESGKFTRGEPLSAVWGEWSDWVDNGDGTQTRTKVCINCKGSVTGHSDSQTDVIVVTTPEPTPHVHDRALTKVAEVPATCTTPGTMAHYVCSCGAKFLTATGDTEVATTDLTIAKFDHKLNGKDAHTKLVSSTNGNCTEHGSAVYTCSICEADEKTVDTGIVADEHHYDMAAKATAIAANPASGHFWPCTRNEAHAVKTADHNFGTSNVDGVPGGWQFTAWQNHYDANGGIDYQFRTATRTCGDCGYTENASTTNPMGMDAGLFHREYGTHSVNVTYVDEEGNGIADPVVYNLRAPASYTVETKNIPHWDLVDGSAAGTYVMGDKDVTYQIVYSAHEYTVYWNNWNGTTLEQRQFTLVNGGKVPAADTYTGSTPVRVASTGLSYRFIGWSEGLVSSSNGSVTYTARFEPDIPEPTETPTPTPSEVIIDEPDTPLVDEPDLPEVEIDEPETPLAPEPELPEIEIDDPEVPLANVPQTGDMSVLWYAAAALPVCGLAMTFLPKKKEDAEE